MTVFIKQKKREHRGGGQGGEISLQLGAAEAAEIQPGSVNTPAHHVHCALLL